MEITEKEKKVKMKTIAKVYIEGKYFIDEANQTIGKPGIGPNAMEIFQNRRRTTSKLSEEGKQKLQEKIKTIENEFGIKILKVKWDRHCGCSMCPCSPGFRVYGDDSIKLEKDWSERRFPDQMLWEGWIQ